MTDEPLKALIKYRMERAEETYKEALLMRTEDHWNACANRLYYACFYAVSALLAKYGLSSSKHSGIKSLFNQHIIKKKLLDISDAPPAEREASGSPLEGGWIKRSSIKIRYTKHEIRNVIKNYGTQILTDFHR